MKSTSILLLGLAASVAIVFFTLVISFTVDIPQGDDLYCLLKFTQDFQDAGTLAERIILLKAQWVEHRILFSRFTALLSYWIHGKVNFVTITLIGNSFLLALTLLFRAQLRAMGLSNPLYLLPVVFALFNPVTYEANVWAGAATVYMPVCFFGLLVPFLLARDGRGWFLAALLTAVIATMSFGNGMFSFLSGLLVLIYRGKLRESMIWTIAGCVSIFTYFNGLDMHSATKSFEGIAVHFQHPEYLIFNLLVFVGGIFSYIDNTNSPFQVENIPAAVTGALLLATICWGVYYLLFRKNFKTDRKARVAWLGMVSFVTFTALAMSYSRTLGESMNTVSSRYRIYSMAFWILAYLWCVMYFPKKTRVSIGYSVSGFLLLAFSYFANYEHLSSANTALRSGLYNFIQHHDWLIYRYTAYYAHASVDVSDSIRARKPAIYDFRQPFPQLTRAALDQAAALQHVTVSPAKNCYGKSGDCVFLHSSAFPAVPNVHTGIYIIVYDEADIYMFPADPLKNGRVNMLRSGSYFKPGFNGLIDFGQALPKPAQSYQLAIFCPSLASDPLRRIDYPL